MSQPVVVARNLKRTYVSPDGSTINALDDVSVDILPGEMTVIAGPSGSGKSTLLQVLAGLDRPQSGTVHIGGEEITRSGDLSLSKLRRRRIGFVFQSFNLIDSLTARENITLPLELDGRAIDENRLVELATALGMETRLDHLPHQLSGGQQQRIAVVRAMLAAPQVIFADEPTASLDPSSGQQMIAMLLDVAHSHGHAVVAISHDPAVAERGDKVYRMAAGRLEMIVSKGSGEAGKKAAHADVPLSNRLAAGAVS